MTRSVWLSLALTACTNSPPVLEPIIDQPLNASASAFQMLDTVTMEVAHEGSATDLGSATFGSGQTPELSGIPFADDLVVHLTGYVGTSEFAYGRTCAVAVTASGPVPRPHLYFSESVKFGQLAETPASARLGGSAMTDDLGGAVVLGGSDSSGDPVTEVERFDPLTGTLTSMYAALTPRTGAVVAALGSSTSLELAVIGGLDPSTGAGAQVVELVVPQELRGPVITINNPQLARLELTATTLSDGSIVVMGGQATTGAVTGEVDQIVLSNGTVSINQLPPTLAKPRRGHTATRLGNGVDAPVLVAGGVDGSGAPIGQAELFLPPPPGSEEASFSGTFSAIMQHPRSLHQAVVMPDGSVLIIGGVDASGPQLAIEQYTNIPGGGFEAPSGLDLPSGAGVVDFAATTLPDGRVLLTGGRTMLGGAPVATAYIAQLDAFGSPVLIATDNLTTPRAQHQATLMCDGTVLISGGTTTPMPNERYNPPPAGRR